MSEKSVEFTDSIHIIYRPEKSSKQLTIILLFVLVVNAIQYKQRSFILRIQNVMHNLKNRSAQSTDQKKV